MTGPTPTDRGKLRSNRCILTDQDGIPLSIARNAKGSFKSCSLSNFFILWFLTVIGRTRKKAFRQEANRFNHTATSLL